MFFQVEVISFFSNYAFCTVTTLSGVLFAFEFCFINKSLSLKLITTGTKNIANRNVLECLCYQLNGKLFATGGAVCFMYILTVTFSVTVHFV